MGGIVNALPITTLETIEHLDFEPETPCEHSSHDGMSHKADLLVRVTMGCCGAQTRVIGICFSVWHEMATGLRCTFCGHEDSREFFWRVVEVLS
jgi:hypothetical protein